MFFNPMAKDYLPREKKKGKNWWAIIFLFFLIIGLSSSFVFFGFGSETKQKHNGKTFHFKGDHWEAKVNGQMAAFTNSPDLISAVAIPAETEQLLSAKIQIDATSLQNDSLRDAIALLEYQMGMVLTNYNSYLRVGFLNETPNFPLITCDGATSFVPVIHFKASTKTQITLSNSCIIVEAKDGRDMLLLKDRLLFSVLGIE